MLHKDWVNKIFIRLEGVYGQQFARNYSRIVDNKDVGLLAAQQSWAEELAFCADQPELISWALKNLPERPPNAIEFKRLCKAAPRQKKPTEDDLMRIECSFTPEQIEENKKKIREMVKGMLKGKIYQTSCADE